MRQTEIHPTRDEAKEAHAIPLGKPVDADHFVVVQELHLNMFGGFRGFIDAHGSWIRCREGIAERSFDPFDRKGIGADAEMGRVPSSER